MKVNHLSEVTKEWINLIPKTINTNGCWIPLDRMSTTAGYSRVRVGRKLYYLHRLVLCIYFNLKYHNQSWDTRHNKGCDKSCFWIEHIKPGTHTDNMKDAVANKELRETKKEVCPKCGREYRIYIVKAGFNKGRVMRRCDNCIAIDGKKRYINRRQYG